MMGIRVDSTGPRSTDRQSHKRDRAEGPGNGGGRMVGNDFQPAEKKTQHSSNLQQPDRQNHGLQYLRQKQLEQNRQQLKDLNPARSESSCSRSVAPQSPFVAATAMSGYAAPAASATTTGAAQQNRPKGVFEFPWQKERQALDMEGWSFRDVFFSSLVDGCSARIGLPGDRLGRRAMPFTVLLEDFPSTITGDHDETDGADYIWNCALQQPLLAARANRISRNAF